MNNIYNDILINLSQKKSLNILEIGGGDGHYSKSLYEYLLQRGCVVNFYGIAPLDIRTTGQFGSYPVKFFLGSRTDYSVLDKVRGTCNSFDLIIDNGSDVSEEVIGLFSFLKKSLKTNSYYLLRKTLHDEECFHRLLLEEIQNIKSTDSKSFFESVLVGPQHLIFKTNNLVRGYDEIQSIRAPRLVFDELKCIYLPICKVATNSLIAAMRQIIKDTFEMPEREYIMGKYCHQPPSKWTEKKIVYLNNLEQEEERKKYFTFAFVRNPWHRAVSGYKELLRRAPFGQMKINELNGLKYEEIHSLMNGDLSFESFVRFITEVEPFHTDTANVHWSSQAKALYLDKESLSYKDFHGISLDIDFIGKMENLQEDFNKVTNKLNLKDFSLAHIHKSKEYDYLSFYNDPRIKEKISEYYRDDIEIFKYDFQ